MPLTCTICLIAWTHRSILVPEMGGQRTISRLCGDVWGFADRDNDGTATDEATATLLFSSSSSATSEGACKVETQLLMKRYYYRPYKLYQTMSYTTIIPGVETHSFLQLILTTCQYFCSPSYTYFRVEGQHETRSYFNTSTGIYAVEIEPQILGSSVYCLTTWPCVPHIISTLYIYIC